MLSPTQHSSFGTLPQIQNQRKINPFFDILFCSKAALPFRQTFSRSTRTHKTPCPVQWRGWVYSDPGSDHSLRTVSRGGIFFTLFPNFHTLNDRPAGHPAAEDGDRSNLAEWSSVFGSSTVRPIPHPTWRVFLKKMKSPCAWCRFVIWCVGGEMG